MRKLTLFKQYCQSYKNEYFIFHTTLAALIHEICLTLGINLAFLRTIVLFSISNNHGSSGIYKK